MMQLNLSILKKFEPLKKWLAGRSLIVKVVIILLCLAVFGLAAKQLLNKKSTQSSYQTTQASKGTLVISVSATGQVSAANSGEVKTKASGVVNKILVSNGQTVKSGEKVAEIDLDQEAKQKYSQALSSYQSAKTNLETAKANLYTTQSEMFTKWQDYMDTAQNATYQNADGTANTTQRDKVEFRITNNDWLASEAKYKNQQAAITQAQSSLNSAWLSLQQASPTIYAPISGKVTGLSLQIGSVLTSQQSTSGTDTAQKIASIQTDAAPTVTVNLTEVDVTKVNVGNIATITFDAFPNRTFTGEVVSIDVIGSVSSGVTSYPAVIKIDNTDSKLFSNMSAEANIITLTKDNVILIPSSAIQTANGESTVRILKNGQPQQVIVQVGDSTSTEAEISSGISEGDEVITTLLQTTSGTTTKSQTSSPFSSFGGGGGANVMRVAH